MITCSALVLVALGSGLTVFVTAGWQLVLSWGVLIGLGTGSMALVFAATIANRWFVRAARPGDGRAHRRRARPGSWSSCR